MDEKKRNGGGSGGSGLGKRDADRAAYRAAASKRRANRNARSHKWGYGTLRRETGQ